MSTCPTCNRHVYTPHEATRAELQPILARFSRRLYVSNGEWRKAGAPLSGASCAVMREAGWVAKRTANERGWLNTKRMRHPDCDGMGCDACDNTGVIAVS